MTPFRELAVEDKQRVARLISELTTVAAERDEALKRLQEEEARFSQHLTALTSRIVVNESAQAGWFENILLLLLLTLHATTTELAALASKSVDTIASLQESIKMLSATQPVTPGKQQNKTAVQCSPPEFVAAGSKPAEESVATLVNAASPRRSEAGTQTTAVPKLAVRSIGTVQETVPPARSTWVELPRQPAPRQFPRGSSQCSWSTLLDDLDRLSEQSWASSEAYPASLVDLVADDDGGLSEALELTGYLNGTL